jgi:hypothetical protein
LVQQTFILAIIVIVEEAQFMTANLEFLKKYGCNIIYAIYKTGSSGLVTNPKDEDYMVIVDEVPHGFARVHIRYANQDYFIWSKDEAVKLYNTKDSEFICKDYIFVTYTMQEFNLVFGNHVVDKNLLQIKEDWFKIVNDIYMSVFKKFNGKHLWYVKIPMMMIENNSLELTQAMYDYCQRSHDYLQNADEFEELKHQLEQKAI